MSPKQYLTLARMSKATVCCANPLRPVVAFSHEAWLEFCKKLEEASRKDTSPVTTLCQKPVAEVIVSHVRSGLDGRYTAEIAGYERLSVGAELFVHPQTIDDKPMAEIWWDDSKDCDWQLKMLVEPAVARGVRIPLYAGDYEAMPVMHINQDGSFTVE